MIIGFDCFKWIHLERNCICSIHSLFTFLPLTRSRSDLSGTALVSSPTSRTHFRPEIHLTFARFWQKCWTNPFMVSCFQFCLVIHLPRFHRWFPAIFVHFLSWAVSEFIWLVSRNVWCLIRFWFRRTNVLKYFSVYWTHFFVCAVLEGAERRQRPAANQRVAGQPPAAPAQQPGPLPHQPTAQRERL